MLSNKKSLIAEGSKNLRRLLLCAMYLLLLATVSPLQADEFDCFNDTSCVDALESSSLCLEPRDYQTTTSDAGSNVTVLSFHGGNIETHTSTISAELAQRFAWNRYDMNGHGTSTCLNGQSNHDVLHITATHYDDPDALNLVGAHPRAVSLHGYSTSRNYPKGTICVGGGSANQRTAFINYVNSHRSEFENTSVGYTLTMINAPLAAAGTTCADLTGTHAQNLVNRVSGGGGGLQLEMGLGLRGNLASTCSESYEPLREVIFGGIATAMGENPGDGFQGRAFVREADGSIGPNIAGVQITFRDESNCLQKTVTTSAYGHYKVRLPARRYVVTATHPDYNDYSSAPGFFVVTGNGYQTGNFFLTEK